MTEAQTTAQAFSWIDVITLASSLVSIFLAIFAIWIANNQRRESNDSYEKTKETLSKVEVATQKIEVLVSGNFADLLTSSIDGQRQMLGSLAQISQPKMTPEEMVIKAVIEKPDPEVAQNIMGVYAAFQKTKAED